jgi:hypothetical protein
MAATRTTSLSALVASRIGSLTNISAFFPDDRLQLARYEVWRAFLAT